MATPYIIVFVGLYFTNQKSGKLKYPIFVT
jgi:hypothetical protein